MVTRDNAGDHDLDHGQYETRSILRYESVYGKDFVSPGGRKLAIELIGYLELDPGSRVLDAGCGLGGSAFVMARDYGLQVDGLDLSRNMLRLANKKLAEHELESLVSLQYGDCLDLDHEDYYDAVYSRDVFLHIEDKEQLFAVLFRALRPGGKLLFTDYCCGEKPWSESFSSYVADRGYTLHTPREYSELVSSAGFVDTCSDDITERFVSILRNDLEKINAMPVNNGSASALIQNWNGKIERAISGDHRWGLVSARKPS
jgi:phosphoethanolamine N-methyltransferase